VLEEQNNLRLVASGRNVPFTGSGTVASTTRPNAAAPAASAAPAAAAVGTAAGATQRDRFALLR
jgi:hypothetical protein